MLTEYNADKIEIRFLRRMKTYGNLVLAMQTVGESDELYSKEMSNREYLIKLFGKYRDKLAEAFRKVPNRDRAEIGSNCCC